MYEAYQRAAKALATPPWLQIPERPVVHMTEQGAFVEVMLWVPRDAAVKEHEHGHGR